ncbi:hypothetical protein [Streptomyces sp. NPDC015131]|uniref:hypothetical protein n=1 Tax=Streptomyces sp. NPDC015131 TaxID=3364941 RepID=UPI0036F715E1
MDAQIITTVVAVVAIVGAYLGAARQARAAVESVRRGHQQSAYSDLIRAARRYLKAVRGAVPAAVALDENVRRSFGATPEEEDDLLDAAAVAQYSALITRESTDCEEVTAAATLVELEAPGELAHYARLLAEHAEELASVLAAAGRPDDQGDDTLLPADPRRATDAQAAVETALANFVARARISLSGGGGGRLPRLTRLSR